MYFYAEKNFCFKSHTAEEIIYLFFFFLKKILFLIQKFYFKIQEMQFG